MAVNKSQGFRSSAAQSGVLQAFLEEDTAYLPDIAVKRGPGR
jgi:hypothetical protein